MAVTEIGKVRCPVCDHMSKTSGYGMEDPPFRRLMQPNERAVLSTDPKVVFRRNRARKLAKSNVSAK